MFLKREPYRLFNRLTENSSGAVVSWKAPLLAYFIGSMGGGAGYIFLYLLFGPMSWLMAIFVSSLSSVLTVWLFWYFA
jgi:hypothetical protein